MFNNTKTKIKGNTKVKISREVKKLEKKVDAIEALDEKMQELSDEELKAKTQEFKDRLTAGETLDDLLVEAFAVVREAADRVLHMKPYRVQLIGGIVLHQGRIAEMKTGEGKTLVSTLPAYLNALEGKGVHIVTVNDYLAKRDAEWMGQVHRFLGLSVGVILNEYDNADRKAAYNCDITYITNNELGFDYLRDNMVLFKKDLVQRGLNYAIVDEVDSVLIDEARTPLIISGQGSKSTDLYKACDVLAQQMTRGTSDGELSKIDAIMGVDIEEDGDFLVNEKDKQVMLTAEGIKKVEEFFHIKNIADTKNLEIQHNVILALRAHNLMFKDKDYVVKDGEVLIVDEFTGRIMPGRRYSDGLHQAIEAKEHVEINDESRTLATITFQNFFNKYEKKAGMTGTAKTEEKEFVDIYKMDVVEIPTNKPVIRVDHEDSVYLTKKEKLNAVADEIERTHETGQPILVGTVSIEVSEELSSVLAQRGIKHSVLNAKFHEQEAEIISHAGEKGAVTIATNMAGRGTDIKLEEGVAELGGLKVIGTERHESRRIDNQLRGRSGRQGDPGESKFYLSLEDDLMRLFGSEKMMKVYKALKVPEGHEIQDKSVSKQIEKAQKRIEGNNFGIRKNLLDYDKVNNEQREVIYKERRRVLDGDNMRDVVYKMINDVVRDDVEMVAGIKPLAQLDLSELNLVLRNEIPLVKITLSDEEKKKGDKREFISRLQKEALEVYHKKEKEFNDFTKVNRPDDVELGEEDAALYNDGIREVERVILLKIIDSKWMNHIDNMEQLRESIGLQSYAQKDPVVQYKFLGYKMFEEMAKNVRHDTISALMHVQIERKEETKPTMVTQEPTSERLIQHGPYKRVNPKIGRNEKCPCGSGKKYKNCCGRAAS